MKPLKHMTITALLAVLLVLGVPSGKILASAWERMNINVQAIAEVKDAVEVFLELFKLNGLENYYYE